jgi:aryl-alcohol dehydrogenase-like predicted oxidoreductase
VITLPRLTVGTMNFGKRTPAPESERIIHHALDRGLTFFDTANLYLEGESERILGAALKGRRDRAGIATKVGLLRKNGQPEGLAPERVREALEESLRRLQTDHIELYYLHAPDPRVPLESTLDALAPLLEARMIGAWGVSNFAAWQILELNHLCDVRGMPRPAVSQVVYNLLVRQLDLEYFAFTRKHPLHTTVYNPLAAGVLAREPNAEGRYPKGSRIDSNPIYQRRYGSVAFLERAAAYRALAQRHGMSGATLAYAWLARAPGVDSLLCGPATLAHLDEAVIACGTTLADEVLSEIDTLHKSLLGTDASYAR